MFRYLFRFSSVLFLAMGSVFAGDKTKDAELQVLKHFVGTWKSEGELKSPTGSDAFKMKEEWTAKLNDSDELVIEGNRILNDGFPDKFRWTMNHNPTTDLIEALHIEPNDPDDATRFEGTFTVDPPALELRSGDSLIRFSFKGDGLTVIDTEVRLCDESGKVNLEGTVTHRKEK